MTASDPAEHRAVILQSLVGAVEALTETEATMLASVLVDLSDEFAPAMPRAADVVVCLAALAHHHAERQAEAFRMIIDPDSTNGGNTS